LVFSAGFVHLFAVGIDFQRDRIFLDRRPWLKLHRPVFARKTKSFARLSVPFERRAGDQQIPLENLTYSQPCKASKSPWASDPIGSSSVLQALKIWQLHFDKTALTHPK
jgi:hypothetical protein